MSFHSDWTVTRDDTADSQLLTMEQALNIPEEDLLHHPIVRVAMERVWIWAGGVGTPPPVLIMPPVSTYESRSESNRRWMSRRRATAIPPYPPPPYPSSGHTSDDYRPRDSSAHRRTRFNETAIRARNRSLEFDQCLNESIQADIRHVVAKKEESVRNRGTELQPRTQMTDAEMMPPPPPPPPANRLTFDVKLDVAAAGSSLYARTVTTRPFPPSYVEPGAKYRGNPKKK